MNITRYSKDNLPSISKREAFKELDCTFDYALPQNWLDRFVRVTGLPYGLVLLTTVWAYPDHNIMGIPVSCCIEVQAELDKKG